MTAVNKNSGSGRSKVSLEGVDAKELQNILNTFFTRFETHDFYSVIAVVKQSPMPDNIIIIDQAFVSKLFKRISENKCPGPDGICSRTLKFCADQLSGVFQHLFQTSVDTCIVPAIWKLSTVTPIPKKDNPKLPNCSTYLPCYEDIGKGNEIHHSNRY